MYELKIKVSDASARVCSQKGKLTTGMVGAKVQFSFNDIWNDLAKVIVFRVGSIIRDIENVETEVEIPVDVLQEPNQVLEVGVYGYDANGELVIPTTYVRACVIHEGADPSGNTPESLPIYAKMKQYIDNIKNALTQAINDLNEVYLSLKGGKLAGKLFTRDVYVGGALDAYGNWGPRNPFIVDHTPLYESVKNELYISTMNIQEDGHYHLILPEGSNYLYKLQITEDNRTRVFDVDQMPVTAAGTYLDTEWYDAGDGICVIFSAKTRVDSSTKTFNDGFIGKKRLNFQKETEYDDDNPDNPYPAVEFYTEGQAEVTIWWVAGDDNRFFAIQSEKRSGASRLEVSGNFIAHGNAGVKNTLTTRHLRVEEKTELGGDLNIDSDLNVDGTARVGNDLIVNGFIDCGESLQMNGNDIKDVQSIEVNGTAKLLNDVMIKHNTNRDHTVKLSTVLDEALDYNFKSRVYVDKMPGGTFTQQLVNAINEVNDGGVVCIPSGEYTLNTHINISAKSVKLLGVGKEKPIINFASDDVYFAVDGISTGFTIEKLVMNCNGAYPNAVITHYSDGDNLTNYSIIDCQFNNTRVFMRVTDNIDGDITILRSEINGVNDHPNIITVGLNNLTIVDSYLNGGNSSDGGASGANIATGARNIKLENCTIIGYNSAIYPKDGVENLIAYNCTVDVYGSPQMIRDDDANRINSVALIGGNLGLQVKNPDGKFITVPSESAEEGGYYIPVVTQVDENTMRVSFTSSKDDMEDIVYQDIILPAGEDGTSGVYVGSEKPIDDSVMVWVKPDGTSTGGSGNNTEAEEWELAAEFTTTEDVATILQDLNGTYKKIHYYVLFKSATSDAVRVSLNKRPGAADRAYISHIPYNANNSKGNNTIIGDFSIEDKNYNTELASYNISSEFAYMVNGDLNLSPMSTYKKHIDKNYYDSLGLDKGIKAICIYSNGSNGIKAGAKIIVHGVRA